MFGAKGARRSFTVRTVLSPLGRHWSRNAMEHASSLSFTFVPTVSVQLRKCSRYIQPPVPRRSSMYKPRYVRLLLRLCEAVCPDIVVACTYL